jgi:Fe-S-cluster containining protein
MSKHNTEPWNVAGLHFECQQCGNCCSGPDEGYIWVTKAEIEMIADFLKISIGQLREKYCQRLGMRTTIIEQPITKDCIFLKQIDGQKKCMIYPVRPNQCRTWPFWPENLTSPNSWNEAAQKCPGVNRGSVCDCSEIERIRKSKKWWLNQNQSKQSSEE